MILLNPKQPQYDHLDDKTQELLKETIAFFEKRGKKRLKEADHEREWYADFLAFQKEVGLFATFLTPEKYADSVRFPSSRWDTQRNCQLNEILGFYGLAYWYTWQVTILGLGPIWMGDNEEVKIRTAKLLQEGAIFAFGLSEKEHGADIYSSSMELTEQGSGQYRANGEKYYIGNANEGALVSTFGKQKESGDYVFFVVESDHEDYHCIKNVCNSQNYVGHYRLEEYPITDREILTKGSKAWDSALNTINVGKFNLGWASIGMCTHSLYEALDHASKRNLFGKYVTEFTHIKQLFVDAYSRLVAMKLFAMRGADYMRVASPDDRRYLLYSPMVKMKVTTQGEEVVNLLWDVIAAKGFEKDMYFEMAARDIRALPKLEGTTHVNMALIMKFMANYFFKPGEFPEIPSVNDAVNDDFLFNQGPTKGLGKLRFHDYKTVYDSISLPNVEIFKKQIKLLKIFLAMARPSKEQTGDFDFLLNLGELFTLVVYGQLVIENAKLKDIDNDLIDQIFDFMIRDFSKYALQLYTKTTSTFKQRALCKMMIKKPAVDRARYERVIKRHVYAQTGLYSMPD